MCFTVYGKLKDAEKKCRGASVLEEGRLRSLRGGRTVAREYIKDKGPLLWLVGQVTCAGVGKDGTAVRGNAVGLYCGRRGGENAEIDVRGRWDAWRGRVRANVLTMDMAKNVQLRLDA